MSIHTAIATLFWSAEAVFALAALVLCVADLGLHRPIALPFPSIYGPVARLGFHANPKVRRIFRLLICNYYRKGLWNPLLNSFLKQKGFDRRRHLSTSNIHAACSAMVLSSLLMSAYTSICYGAKYNYVLALAVVGFEMVYNTFPIILSRYLYLLTLRRTNSGAISQRN